MLMPFILELSPIEATKYPPLSWAMYQNRVKIAHNAFKSVRMFTNS